MRRVFLSFRAEDRKQVDGLRLLAANPGFAIDFYDESVRTPYDSTRSDYIKSNIREKIRRSSVTVCLVNEFTHKSAWVDWELETSFQEGKRIVCMGLPGAAERIILPEPARRRNLPWYAWNIDDLHRLIQQS